MTNCELCGEPMPAGEEMFKYHGYSGPCPREGEMKPGTTLNNLCAEIDRLRDENGRLTKERDVERALRRQALAENEQILELIKFIHAILKDRRALNSQSEKEK